MQQTRRTWLRATAAAMAGVGLAGCQGSDDDDEDPTPTETGEENGQQSESESGNGESDGPPEEVDAAPEEVALAAEWNAIRTRLRDPVILGHADRFDAGEAVAAGIFERFETAAGDPNAHEALEESSEEGYEGFEDGLGGLREALAADDLEAAHDEMKAADEHLREAQGATVGSEWVKPLTLLVLGAHVEDAALLARIGEFGEAAHEFGHIGDKFEEKMQGMVAEVDADAAGTFVEALDDAATAADEEDGGAATSSAAEAFDAATRSLYALVPERLAGAAHLAALQARGWDAAALADLGGPGTAFAHAAALNTYRMRAHDIARLYERGHPDAAAGDAEGALAAFETARAHEALEDADEDAYHQFEEDGLDALATAIGADDPEGVEAAAGAVEAGVTAGIEALGSGAEPALLEAGYVKARIEDALDRYRAGEREAAADTARGVFERFEGNVADFHETLEETGESLYERFEHDHLEALIEAFEAGDNDAVDEHVAGIRETLLEFETAAGSTAVGPVESSYVAGRAFDAGVLATTGEGDRAASVLQSTLQYFERGAGGFHEALEEADHDAYESFEEALAAAADAASGGGATEEVQAFGEQATDAAYTIVSSAGGSFGPAAASVVEDTFAHFEEAHVHELLEEADHDTYEAFEDALEEYAGALDAGTGVDAAAERFATATLRAQFAVAGAPEAGPSVESSDDEESETDLEGGPNVIKSVPDGADHVVETQAVAYEPERLTVQQGDTVAWRHAAGEPHSVTAYEDGIPADAAYWASGGFESEAAAREGWENGQGAVQSGEAYVHTFETAGEHEYVCIPHEAAGMVGTVVVE
jgi:plastocyanin